VSEAEFQLLFDAGALYAAYGLQPQQLSFMLPGSATEEPQMDDAKAQGIDYAGYQQQMFQWQQAQYQPADYQQLYQQQL
ncbi:unnamed protein product, partial [Effrenium voratum]